MVVRSIELQTLMEPGFKLSLRHRNLLVIRLREKKSTPDIREMVHVAWFFEQFRDEPIPLVRGVVRGIKKVMNFT